LNGAGTGSNFFEQAVPYEPYEYGMKDVLRPDEQGFVHCPTGPGFGVEVDWEAMEAATVHRIAVGEGELWG
jgi:L-alanine-DL-glutamate epimerase-like enolase superfamily enzyme